MRQFLRSSIPIGLMLMVLSLLLGCDVGSEEGGLFENDLASCVGSDCDAGSGVNFLKIQPNYNSPFLVNANAVKINIGGFCNSGGFEKTVITWKLLQGQTLKNTSDESFAASNGSNPAYNAECKDGRFSLLVDIEYSYGGNAPLPGLRQPDSTCPSPPGPPCFEAHSLEIDFYGIDETGQRIKNPSAVSEKIRLVPFSF